MSKKEDVIKEVTNTDLVAVALDKIPLGKFMTQQGPFVFAVDNSDGDPKLEFFLEREEAIKWLTMKR